MIRLKCTVPRRRMNNIDVQRHKKAKVIRSISDRFEVSDPPRGKKCVHQTSNENRYVVIRRLYNCFTSFIGGR